MTAFQNYVGFQKHLQGARDDFSADLAHRDSSKTVRTLQLSLPNARALQSSPSRSKVTRAPQARDTLRDFFVPDLILCF